MLILGLDTATRRASVGLLRNGALVAEKCQSAQSSHATSLLPLIDETLHAAGCSVAELDAVAVSSGPGSFSGLRVGVSVAKGLAYAAGIPLVAVGTLEALARTVAERRGVICALLDARKGELYAACFESTAGGLQRRTDDALLTPERLLEQLPTPCTVLGDAVPTYGAWLRTRLGEQVELLSFDTHGPHGAVVAAIGLEGLRTGALADISCLEPFYVRPSDAERKLA